MLAASVPKYKAGDRFCFGFENPIQGTLRQWVPSNESNWLLLSEKEPVNFIDRKEHLNGTEKLLAPLDKDYELTRGTPSSFLFTWGTYDTSG